MRSQAASSGDQGWRETAAILSVFLMATLVRWVVLNVCRTLGERRLVLRLVQALRWAAEIEEERSRKKEIAQIQRGASMMAYEHGGVRLWLCALVASMAFHAPFTLAAVVLLLILLPFVSASYLVALAIVKVLPS